MFRESDVPKKFLYFKGTDAFLKNENPKVRQIAVGKNQVNLKIGSNIQLNREDVIIITAMLKKQILVSISRYVGFGKFEEIFFEIAEFPSEEIYQAGILGEMERKIVEKNIAVLKTA